MAPQQLTPNGLPHPKYFIVHTFRYVDSETNVDYILNSA